MKAADALKDADIENLVAASFKNPELQEAIVRFKPMSFIRKIGEEKGQEYINLIHNKFEEIADKENGIEEIAKTNQILLRQSIAAPAFRYIFPAPKKIREAGIEKEQLKKIDEAIEKVSEEIRKGKEERKST